ncbi:peptidase S8/S53 domain-containing protein [Syncephalis fuscata]|nr:peptidase S8/S53 domain-containing protein [Syncephalis fuscata]
MAIQKTLIAYTLFLCAIHRTVAQTDDYRITNSLEAPLYISQITGKQFNVTPYYKATGIDSFHSKYTSHGQGIKVGIIDSGIDYNHYAFTNPLTQTSIIKFGYDFVGNDFNGRNRQQESANVLDKCNGHGTKLAGIIAAKTKSFVGIASDVELGIYRVFGCTGPTSTSVVLQALKKAIEHKMDVITLPEIAIVDAFAHELREQIIEAANSNINLIVSASSNNYNFEKQSYFSYSRLPVISVGGANLPYYMSHWFRIMNIPIIRVKFQSPCNNMNYDIGAVGIVPISSLKLLDRANIGKAVQGKIVLATDQDTADKDLLDFIQQTNAAGLITTAPDSIRRTCKVPVFILSENDGQYVSQLYHTDNQRMLVFSGENGNINESYHSIVDGIKVGTMQTYFPVNPDILAPSNNLFTTTIDNINRYGWFSDISGAVAYVAGSIALFLQLKGGKRINNANIRLAFQETASSVYTTSSKFTTYSLYHKTGMLNIERAFYNVKESLH